MQRKFVPDALTGLHGLAFRRLGSACTHVHSQLG